MGQLQEEIEDAEFNVGEHRQEALRWTLRMTDFQAIADDARQPNYLREKFAIYAMWAHGQIEASQRLERREQRRLEDLLIEQRAEKAERESEFNRAMGYPMESFPSLKRVAA